MGYTTDLFGKLTLTPNANPMQEEYINKFSSTRRMGRKVDELMKKFKGKDGLPSTITPEQQALLDELSKSGMSVTVKSITETRTAEEIYGKEGEFYVGDNEFAVIDSNTPPGQVPWSDKNFDGLARYEENDRRINEKLCQPSLWCQWILDYDGSLVWDGNEKFYHYIDWLEYMITNFFNPWGIMLNGEIQWEGESSDDIGKIVVKDNVVTVKKGTIVFD
jgi:hypothetical protein